MKIDATLRPLLNTYAYNILGSLQEAEDIVQDAYLKFMEGDRDQVEDKKAYLVRMVINMAINRKKRQQKIRASYPGEWLPEPVATERADASVEKEELLSYSLMLLMERLTPKQRAVFILKEGFDYGHEEIAGLLDITVPHSRKLLSRAKGLLQDAGHMEEETPGAFVTRYLDAIREGDMKKIEKLLSEEVLMVSDGGGKASAIPRPLQGRESVVAFISAVFSKFYSGAKILTGEVNHQPAIFYFENGKLSTCQVISLREGTAAGMYFMRNPEKLVLLEKSLN
jgi:RNA polymerase sigma-70 factor (ECF subfamily)